tara:strand:+ start:1058 stop:1600 length:543 start_codon:yes stop_codon:yes gene_type:complete
MGLKQDLIDAKEKAARDTGVITPIDTKPGSFIEREAHYTMEAIVKFLTEAEFRITQLNAPVVLEDLKSVEQPVNVELETMLGEYGPILKTLKQMAQPIGLGGVIDELEGQIEKAVEPLLKGGAILPAMDINKDGGGLDSTGYVFIGSEPDSQDDFDVEDESGQREFTTVKLIRDDIEDLL